MPARREKIERFPAFPVGSWDEHTIIFLIPRDVNADPNHHNRLNSDTPPFCAVWVNATLARLPPDFPYPLCLRKVGTRGHLLVRPVPGTREILAAQHRGQLLTLSVRPGYSFWLKPRGPYRVHLTQTIDALRGQTAL